MKRGIALAATVIGIALMVMVMITGWSVGRSVGASAEGANQLTAARSGTHYTLSIDTPAMLGGTEDTGPAYVPSSFTLPANTDVTITVVNFDGPTALPPASAKYATATGIEGKFTVQSLNTVDPNATTGDKKLATSLDPETDVSHTFTIAALGLNVPISPLSTTTFTFHTAAAGTYEWRCMDPCGSGVAGWGGAMNQAGYMLGKVTFA